MKKFAKISKVSVTFAKKKFEDKHADDKKYHIVRVHSRDTNKYRGTAQSICNLR